MPTLQELLQAAIPELLGGQTAQGPLQNTLANTPNVAQTQSQPTPNFAPAIQPDNQGGGNLLSNVGNYLKDTGTDFAKAMVPAIGARVLFGNTPLGNSASYEMIRSQLEKRSQQEELERQHMLGDLASAVIPMRSKARELGVDPNVVLTGIMSGQSTGHPELDNMVQGYNQMVMAKTKGKSFGSSDMLTALNSVHGYEEAFVNPKLEGVKNETIYGPNGETKSIPVKTGTTYTPPDGWTFAKPEKSDVLSPDAEAQKIRMAGATSNASAEAYARNRKPSEPKQKKLTQTWMYSPDGTMRFPAVFDSATGVTTPQAKGGKWTKAPGKGEGSVSGGVADMMQVLNVASDSPPQTTPQTQKESTTQTTPAVGTIKNGYKFIGGNPADAKNWQKVKT